MRTRTTVVLALLLAVASVWAWLETPPGPPTSGSDAGAGAPPGGQAPGDAIVRLLHFSSPAVQRITLQRDTFHATLTRTDHGWSGVTDAGGVEDFLRSLQELAQIMIVGSEEGGPTSFGLDPPVARITLERSADDPVDIRIGTGNPTSTGVYAQVGAEGPVVLTGALVLWDLDKIVRLIQGTHTPSASDSAGSGRPTP